MTTKTIEDLVREQPFLQGLDDEAMKLICGCGKNVRFKQGDYVFRQGESATYFYILREGTVALEIFVPGQGPVPLQTLAEGDILGVSWLVPPYRWGFDARVIAPVRAIAFDAGCLRGKCDENCQMGYDLMRKFVPILVERLQASRLQAIDLYRPPGEGE